MTETLESPRREARRGRLATDAAAEDPGLRGRAYPVRFGSVWSAALSTAEALGGWRVIDRDPVHGEIRAEACGRLWKRPDEVHIRLSLDEVGLTRVDLVVTPLARRIGRRRGRRRIGRYLRALDAALRAAR